MSTYRGKRRNVGPILLLIVVAAAVIAAVLAVVLKPGEKDPEQTPALPTESTSPAPTTTPTPTPTPTSTPTPTPEAEPYDFTQPVPQSENVDDSYFADAVFIGDSRTEGFMLYSGVKGADSLAHTGLNIFGVAEKKVIGTGDNKKTVLEALKEKQYGKVYLTLGVNELGYANDKLFYSTFCDVIDAIRAAQPNAVIYIENLIPLNESQVSKDYLNNTHLRTYNDLMAQVAEEKQVAYLDLYSAFVDENGQLPEDASNDGVHLKKPYCQKWLEYLRCHAVTPEQLGMNET